MIGKFAIDLHKLSRFVTAALPLLAVGFFFAGWRFSFYFHFLTVGFLFATLLNFFLLYGQKRHAILGNFGLIGQGRYLIESIGPELRQYWFLSDTEERPFNRMERSEVYRKAKNIDSATSFGSLRAFDATEIKVRHTMYPIGIDELEPFRLIFGEERGAAAAYEITKPFMISAMSYGALGEHAVRALARGAKRAGIPMNTGEGGCPKYHLEEGCDLIFQLGTAKFGARREDGTFDEGKLAAIAGEETVKMVEIKLSQGAKPGKGGLLPKEKITDEIAALRGVPRDRDVVSPPGHPECPDAAATVAFIRRIQEVTGLPAGIKLCLGDPREFAELAGEMKRQDVFPDWIAVDGSEGGTGAAPKAFIDSVGMPLYPALKAVNDALVSLGVRDRLKLVASGKLIAPGPQLVAFCLGADAIYTARGFMLAIGCVQAMQCANNTCPVGITTHDPSLQRGLDPELKSLRVAHYANNLFHDLEHLLASVGCRSLKELSYDKLYAPSGSILGDAAPARATAPQPRS